MPVTFSLVGVVAVHEGGGLVASQPGGDDAGHLVQRRDEAVDLPADLDALAERRRCRDRMCACRRRPEMPRLTSMPASLASRRSAGCRPPSRRESAGMTVPSASSHAFDALARRGSPWCCALVMTSMPRSSTARCSRWPAAGSSCRSIKVGIRCRTVTSMPRALSPAAASSPSRPPPMTTAFAARLGREQHGVDVVEIAIGQDAGQVVAGHRNDEGHRAGRDHQLVVGLDDAVTRRSPSSPCGRWRRSCGPCRGSRHCRCTSRRRG